MEIKLLLKNIAYGGKSVGENIRMELKLLGQTHRIDKRIRRGVSLEFSQEIGIFETSQFLDATIDIKIIEKDLLFSDVGQISQELKIDVSKSFPQKFEYQVPVQERRRFFWKRVAVFKIVIVAELVTSQSEPGHRTGRIGLYSDISPEIDSANLRVEPNDSSKILMTVSNHANVIVIKTANPGKIPSGFLSDLWHEILYQDIRGFVHSSLIEINGQERKRIIETIKSKAQELGIDEKLALNLAHCESKWLPFAHSRTGNKGIYQLGADTILDINQKFGGSINDPWNPEQNIDGGLRYFKQLMSRYAGNPDFLIRSLVAWNAGPNRVPISGQFDLNDYVLEVQNFVRCVLEEKRGEKILPFLFLWILPWVIGIGGLLFFTSDTYDELHATRREDDQFGNREVTRVVVGQNFVVPSPLMTREIEVPFAYLQTDLDGDGKLEQIEFAFYSPEPFFYYTNINLPGGGKIILDGDLHEAFIADLTGDGSQELIVETTPGQLSETKIFSTKGL